MSRSVYAPSQATDDGPPSLRGGSSERPGQVESVSRGAPGPHDRHTSSGRRVAEAEQGIRRIWQVSQPGRKTNVVRQQQPDTQRLELGAALVRRNLSCLPGSLWNLDEAPDHRIEERFRRSAGGEEGGLPVWVHPEVGKPGSRLHAHGIDLKASASATCCSETTSEASRSEMVRATLLTLS